MHRVEAAAALAWLSSSSNMVWRRRHADAEARRAKRRTGLAREHFIDLGVRETLVLRDEIR
jgi:hypothetical protein